MYKLLGLLSTDLVCTLHSDMGDTGKGYKQGVTEVTLRICPKGSNPFGRVLLFPLFLNVAGSKENGREPE